MGKKAAETTMAKRKMGTLIHVKATALHSKGNKSHLARLHGPKFKDKKINGKVVGVEFIKSDKGINNCHIKCVISMRLGILY